MKVSICILNWNQGDVLRQSMPTIVKQLSKINHEILVYDQNSDDGSQNWLRNSSCISHLFLSKTNTGNCCSRNEMIQLAQGEYIFLLDSDIIPIEGSIPAMLRFLEDNLKYTGVGYDPYCVSTTDHQVCTPLEHGIGSQDIELEYEHVFTQYGLFRRETLLDFPFPEFSPFDQPGWGAEDTIVCKTMLAKGHQIARIMGRVYWHKTHSSTALLADAYLPSRARRRIAYKYFMTLDVNKQQEALKNKTLPKTALDLYLYTINKSKSDRFRISDNLGDRLFPWLLDSFFPFYQFSNSSKNILFFGGSVFEHTKNLDFNPKNLIYYGCGLSAINELAIPTDSNVRIFTRGPHTTDVLNDHGYEVIKTVGDPAMCLTLLPEIKVRTNAKKLWVKDAFTEMEPCHIEHEVIGVAYTDLTKGINIYAKIEDFFRLLSQYSALISSQIHPFLMAVIRGIPAKLLPKDWRAKDICDFFQIPVDCELETCRQLRHQILDKQIESFLFPFISEMQPFMRQ